MKVRLLYVIAILFMSNMLFAQQEIQLSHNMFNILSFNPGYAGSKEAICATGTYRSQWMGFEETVAKDGATNTYKVAPITSVFSADIAINPLKSGIGISVMQDKLGHTANTSFEISYAYRLAIGPGKLGIGLGVGFENRTIRYGELNPLQQNDPLLSGGQNQSAMLMGLSVGLFYKMPQAYFGVSSTKLNQAEFSVNQLGTISDKRHYYFQAGYHYMLTPDVKVTPSLLMKTDFASTQYDLNCLVTYNSRFWGGLTFRPNDAAAVLVGMNWNDINIGFSYDITTSAIGGGGRSSGTVEAMLNYCFKIEVERLPSSHGTVRFL